MAEQDWQGPDAEAGALLEALGCDTGRGEHEETTAALRRAFEAGARAVQQQLIVRAELFGPRNELDRLRALPLPSPEREEPSR